MAQEQPTSAASQDPGRAAGRSPSETSRRGAASVWASFGQYQAEFRAITHRARLRFEARDWAGAHADALERLELRSRSVARAVEDVARALGPAAGDPSLRPAMKGAYENHLLDRPDPELARTFYNSVTRRLFGTVGVDWSAEFRAGGDPPPCPPGGAAGIATLYPCGGSRAEIAASVRRMLRDRPFGARWRDLDGDAARVAEELEASLAAAPDPRPLRGLEVLDALFYRGKGAYVVGRLHRGGGVSPVIVALLHEPDGVYVDALLLTPQDASIVFSFTRSYFHVEVDRAGAAVGFLRSLLPQKKTSELYIAIGYNKQGKTVLWRELEEHLTRTHEVFAPARGQRGMVMIVFTLPSLDVVFKVIRDRFAPPKTITRAEVIQKYALVFRHDRAGRLVDAQEFEGLVFDRERFSPEVLDELLSSAGETVRLLGDRVFIRHLYVERRVVPLDLFIREHDAHAAREALLDYGQALRDLAATNTFPGDLLLKNFGVTRNGRVIFYDYDELCLVTDCQFRDLPQGRDDGEDMAAEPWFYVGESDVFPEEFLAFLGLPDGLREAFVAAHGEILTADFWRRMQERHRRGEIVDIFPYRESRRLRARPGGGPAAGQAAP